VQACWSLYDGSYRGVYRAAMCPRDFAPLRKIVMQSNMLRDNAPTAYFEAICEVIDVRKAPQDPGPWQPFPESEVSTHTHAHTHAQATGLQLLLGSIASHSHLSLVRCLCKNLDGMGLACWVGQVCTCCGADFTWHSTSSSEAQRNRDRHNCRCCGRLVSPTQAAGSRGQGYGQQNSHASVARIIGEIFP
jgi:hypothetical protein